MKFVFTAACLLGALATQSPAASFLMFQGVAPAGGVTNISPSSPYTEDGFTLTPSTGSSAVFDAGDSAQFPGDPTSWFGFASDNEIALTGPVPFNLDTILVGPSTIGSGNINFTVTGNVFGGGTDIVTFRGLTTATEEHISFANLASVTFDTSSDAGIDNIELNSPEPGSLLLLGAGLAALGAVRRRRQVSKTRA